MLTEKTELRRLYLEKRRGLDEAQRQVQDKAICRHVSSFERFLEADTLLLYYPTGSEVDVLPLFESFRARGCRVAFPRCNASDRTMTFHFVEDLSQMVTGVYKNIPEPSAELEAWQGDGKVFCIVPGVVFDRYGYRIGYGGGYYDRFLKDFKGFSAGVTRDGFFTDTHLPSEHTDVRCDAIAVGEGVYFART